MPSTASEGNSFLDRSVYKNYIGQNKTRAKLTASYLSKLNSLEPSDIPSVWESLQSGDQESAAATELRRYKSSLKMSKGSSKVYSDAIDFGVKMDVASRDAQTWTEFEDWVKELKKARLASRSKKSTMGGSTLGGGSSINTITPSSVAITAGGA